MISTLFFHILYSYFSTISLRLLTDRDDVKDAFEPRGIQVNYDERVAFSYPIKAQGFNDRLAWVVDLSCQSTYEVPVDYGPWF